MRMAMVVFMIFCMASFSHAEAPVKGKQATIRGESIKVGQEANIVQNKIKADKYISTYNYGDPSKGYYNDAGVTYIITYGPPKSGIGSYVVTQIEKVTAKKVTAKQEKQLTSSSRSSKGVSKAKHPVTIGTLADTVLEKRGKSIGVRVVGRDEHGLLVEWQYPDATYLMGRRLQGGIEAYRVIKITPR